MEYVPKDLQERFGPHRFGPHPSLRLHDISQDLLRCLSDETFVPLRYSSAFGSVLVLSGSVLGQPLSLSYLMPRYYDDKGAVQVICPVQGNDTAVSPLMSNSHNKSKPTHPKTYSALVKPRQS